MLSRRKLLLGAAATTSLLGLGALHAAALSSEPMTPSDLRALSLACDKSTSHAQLIGDARMLLVDAVKRGLKPADYSETVVCPFCRCAFQVSPDAGL